MEQLTLHGFSAPSQSVFPETKVLDHGYVRTIEVWGSDERIVESARMSTNKGFLGWGTDEKPGDERLLKFLYENWHMTPFEMAGMTIEVQAPIFVFREWHRHRTQSYNELSARYTPLPDLNYVPTLDRIREGAKATANKQAQGVTVFDEEQALCWLDFLTESYKVAQDAYEQALEAGVPKELARLSVPVARYSRMRASANLRNWLAFLTLRQDPAAQFEIRQFADVVASLIGIYFTRTYGLYCAGRK